MSVDVQPDRGNTVRLFIWGLAMKTIGTLAAACLALSASALDAGTAKPAPGVVPLAGLTDDRAIDCLLRMVRLSNASAETAKDEKATAEQRKTAGLIDDQAARGVSFYTGFLYTRPWVADRSAQASRLSTAQAAESEAASSAAADTCLRRAMDAQENIFAATLGQ